MIDLPPPGFQALDPNKPIQVYRRHLPHWRQDGATYFVTFHLADSLPHERLVQLKEEREIWKRAHVEPSSDDWEQHGREERLKVEKWLDQGQGRCVLSNAETAGILENALHHFNKEWYSLFGHIIMPNHVHVVLRPLKDHPLERAIASWKKYSARRINSLTGCSGKLWQEEYYDRIVRDTPHLRKVIRYLERNAKQTSGRCQTWVTPAWRAWLGGEEDDASGEASSKD